MAGIEVHEDFYSLIVFNTDDWKSVDDENKVTNEIINFMEENEDRCQNYLIQNEGYVFGDTMTNPIIMVCTNHYGGFKGTLKTFIQDAIYDLIPENGYEKD